MISAGNRLHDFKILVGNEFVPGGTEAWRISLWSECARVSGKQLIQLFTIQTTFQNYIDYDINLKSSIYSDIV